MNFCQKKLFRSISKALNEFELKILIGVKATSGILIAKEKKKKKPDKAREELPIIKTQKPRMPQQTLEENSPNLSLTNK